MKKILIILLAVVTLYSCKQKQNSTYSTDLKKEKALIKEYIKREGINILDKEPAVWGEKDYLAIEGYDYFYYHLSRQGDTTSTEVKNGDKIVLRYRQYSLDVYADTISYWTTDDGGYPVEFLHMNTNDTKACLAWHLAIKQMKYSGSECRIICPSKLGFTNDNYSVIPYVFDLSFKIKRY